MFHTLNRLLDNAIAAAVTDRRPQAKAAATNAPRLPEPDALGPHEIKWLQ